MGAKEFDMKKAVALAIAAGALVTGTAAMAVPAVVAGASPMYSDSYGQTYSVDAYGRPVYVQPGYVQPAQQIVGYDQWGRAVYGAAPVYVNPPVVAYVAPRVYSYNGRDRDGDGVPNWNDRRPDDARWR
jgi:hypothetical protein